MIPQKLRPGDNVRVIAPSRSMALPWITKDIIAASTKRLTSYGLEVTFGAHVNEIDEFQSSQVSSRVEDIHAAFADPSVKMILTIMGGFNVNEVLPFLDYEMIVKNPKILCGYSDITALQNALFARTGLVTYSGPHFFDFAEAKGFDYTEEYFKKCLFQAEPIAITPAKEWSNDKWGKDQNKRVFFPNEGFVAVNEGSAEGRILGSNSVTFHALSHTPYMPRFTDSTILFLEEDYEQSFYTCNRTLTSLTQREDFDQVTGIILGRFQPESKIEVKDIRLMIQKQEKLRRLPCVANVDFGHTTPRLTFPIGGRANMNVKSDSSSIILTEH